MCGRLNVIDEPLAQMIFEQLGLKFYTETNLNLCPSQQVSGIVLFAGELNQLNAIWGVKPDWSKKLIINAKSETVFEKKTFKKAFVNNRCLIPCSGWYEWKAAGSKKEKYLFKSVNQYPLYMAGLYYKNEESSRVVTLTTSANLKCEQIHHRMPVLIEMINVECWFRSKADELSELMKPIDSDLIDFFRAS